MSATASVSMSRVTCTREIDNNVTSRDKNKYLSLLDTDDVRFRLLEPLLEVIQRPDPIDVPSKYSHGRTSLIGWHSCWLTR